MTLPGVSGRSPSRRRPSYGELPPVEGAEKFLADLRAHLLENPLLDCDRLLAVRRHPDRLGLHSNWQQPRDAPGCTNELGVSRATPWNEHCGDNRKQKQVLVV